MVHHPVSYTHLDVYKRQLHDSIVLEKQTKKFLEENAWFKYSTEDLTVLKILLKVCN